MADIVMNQLMEEMLKKQDDFSCNEKKIKKLVSQKMRGMKHRKYGEESCVVYDRHKLSMAQIEKNYMDLTGYEWNHNEVYIYDELIKGDFKTAIPLTLNAVKAKLLKKFPNERFFICVSAQDEGELSNVYLNFHVYRECLSYIDPELEKYADPVMYEITEKTSQAL